MQQLTAKEVEICRLAEISVEDATFLKSLTNEPIELLEIPNYNEYPNRADQPILKGIHSYSLYDDADRIVLNAYDRFQSDGKILFRSDTLYLNEKEAIERELQADAVERATICLVATTNDPFHVIEAFETSWPNCRITNEALLKQLKSWNESYGLKIFHISWDFIAAQLLKKDIDYDALAREIFAMCADPDNIHHTLKVEIEGIKKTGNITLWWD